MSYQNLGLGFRTIAAATTNIDAIVPSDACFVPLYQRGPLNGADPIDKVVVGDVKRFWDGNLGNKEFINIIKMQGAYEALRRSGITLPQVVSAKNANSTPTSSVLVGVDGKFSAMTYNKLPLNAGVPYTGVASTGSNLQTNMTPGNVMATFNNGVSVINPGGRGLQTYVTAPQYSGRSLASVSDFNAQTQNTTGTGGDIDISLGQQLDYSPDIIPGVTLFSAPRYGGDIANAGTSGGDYLSAMQRGDIDSALRAQGTGVVSQSLYPGLVAGGVDLSNPEAVRNAMSAFASVPTTVNPNTAYANTGTNGAFVGSVKETDAPCESCSAWK